MASIPIERTEPVAWLRLGGRAVWLSAIMLVCIPLHGLWRLLGLDSPWPQLLLKLSARACGAEVSVIGTPLYRDVFYVANHISWIDIPIVGGITGTAFVSQDKVAHWPVIGWLATLNHTMFVSRTDRATVGEQIGELRAALARTQPLAIFPEGTTTDGRSLLPFKTPLFEGLWPLPRPLMIQPVLLDFDPVGPEIAWIGTETGDDNAVRTLSRKGSFEVRVHFLEPFDPQDFPGRKAIAAESRRRLAAALSKSLGGVPVS